MFRSQEVLLTDLSPAPAMAIFSSEELLYLVLSSMVHMWYRSEVRKGSVMLFFIQFLPVKR